MKWLAWALALLACGGAPARPADVAWEPPQEHLGNELSWPASCRAGKAEDCVRMGDFEPEGELGDRQAAADYLRACQLELGAGCRKLAEMDWDNRAVAGNEARARELWQQGCKLRDYPSCAPSDLQVVKVGKTLEPAPPPPFQEAQAYPLAREAYNLGQWDRALGIFLAMSRLTPRPELVYNIAQTYRMAEDYQHALVYYRRFLTAWPDARNRADVETRVREIEALLARPPPPPRQPRRGRLPGPPPPPAG